MKTNKITLIVLIIMILVAVGFGAYTLYINSQQNPGVDFAASQRLLEEANSKAPPQATIEESTPDVNATVSDPSAPEGCKNIVTAAMVQESMGLIVNEGVSIKSPVANGTNCVLKNDDSTNGLIVQTFPDLEGNYTPNVWPDAIEFTDVGEKGFVQKPAGGVANAEAVKNGKVVYINAYSTSDYTDVQLKALLKAIVDAI